MEYKDKAPRTLTFLHWLKCLWECVNLMHSRVFKIIWLN